MKVKLLGVQQVSFTNNVGETIEGVNLFVGFNDSNVEGLKTEKIFS